MADKIVVINESGPGLPGKSAYQSWLDLGNTGSEEDFINDLRGDGGSFDGDLDDIDEGVINKHFTATEKSKLSNIPAGATVNSTDSALRDRSTHTGSQLAATISDFASAVDTRVNILRGSANGIAPLGADSKIPLAYIPDALIGAANYQGAWNASTNSPALATGDGEKGHYYVVSTPGATEIDGISDWKLGDWIIFNGTAWEKIDNTDAVISVNGKVGAVVLTPEDLGLENSVESDTTGITGATAVGNIVSISQAAYDALDPGVQNANTFLIVE